MVLQNTNGWFLLAEIVIIWSGVEPRHQGVSVFGTSIFKRCLGDAHVQSKLRASEHREHKWWKDRRADVGSMEESVVL